MEPNEAERAILELALRCIRGEAPVIDLARAIGDHRHKRLGEVVFGPTSNAADVRHLLKEAEYVALKGRNQPHPPAKGRDRE